MFKQKLNWKRPLFYAVLPVLLIMVFLGFHFRLPRHLRPGHR